MWGQTANAVNVLSASVCTRLDFCTPSLSTWKFVQNLALLSYSGSVLCLSYHPTDVGHWRTSQFTLAFAYSDGPSNGGPSVLEGPEFLVLWQISHVRWERPVVPSGSHFLLSSQNHYQQEGLSLIQSLHLPLPCRVICSLFVRQTPGSFILNLLQPSGTLIWSSGSQRGTVLPLAKEILDNILSCLNWGDGAGVVLLSSKGGSRPEMLLTMLQCTGEPHNSEFPATKCQ